MVRAGYPPVPPSHLVGSTVLGQVSHLEETFFWVQKDPDKIADLCGSEGDAPSTNEVGVGDCVVGSWEGGWYRGVVREELENEVVVQFVDWGNAATLPRDKVRRTMEEEMVETIGAVKCKLVAREMEGWEDELQQSDYMVKLRCLAYYEDSFLVTKDLKQSNSLPIQEDIPGTITEIGPDKKTGWFCPSSLQQDLDTLMGQMELLGTSLTHLPISHMFPGQLCATKFSEDGALYRAKITLVKDQLITVAFIDYGNSEDKAVAELFMLPEELLGPAPHVLEVELSIVIREEDEVKVLGEGIVVKLVERNGMKIAKIFVDEKEIVSPASDNSLVVEKLPFGVKIRVSLGHVATVDQVWVTPLDKVEGVEARVDMVDQIGDILALHQELLVQKSNINPGQTAVIRFSEDGMLYRCRVEEKGMVRFIDYGNGEEKAKDELYEMPQELVKFPPGSLRVTIVYRGEMKDTEENRKVVEEKLGGDDVFVIMGQGDTATFFRGEQEVTFSPTESDLYLRSKKGKIIEAEMVGETEVNDVKDDKTSVSVVVTQVDTVNTVWVTRSSNMPVLELLMDQLACLEDHLVPLTEIHEDDLVVARFSEDSGLYRGKVIACNDKIATVLFIDYGIKEEQSMTDLWRMPCQFSEHQAMADMVRLEGVGECEDSLENREVVDKELDKDGILMMVNSNHEASFWIEGEKIMFNLLKISSPTKGSGWNVGDKVTYWTEASNRWRKGTISSLEQSQASVQCDGDTSAIHCKVDFRHLKPAGMPVEALNKVEDELSVSGSVYNSLKYTNSYKQEDEDIKIQITSNKMPSPKAKQVKPEPPCLSIPTAKSDKKNKSPAVPKAKLIPLAVFRPTSDITQQMLTDWIAGCLQMLDSKKELDKITEVADVSDYTKLSEDVSKAGIIEVINTDDDIIEAELVTTSPKFQSSPPSQCSPHLSSSPASPAAASSCQSAKHFLSSAQTVTGSQALLARLDEGDENTCDDILNIVVTTDMSEMLSNPLSCMVVQKLCSQVGPTKLDMLLLPISEQFVNLSTHPSGHLAVLGILAVANQDQRDKLISQLEDKEILLRLLKDKQGSFVVQKILPYLLPRTLASIVRSLQGQVVEIGCDPHATFFMQEFFRQFSGKDIVDLLLEEVMDNLSSLVFSGTGNWLVQEVINLGKKNQIHLTRVACWLEKNVQAVLMDTSGAVVARTVVQLLMARITCGEVSCWSQLLDRLVMKMINTIVVEKRQKLPLLIVAAEHHAGHNVVLELAANKECLVDTKDTLVKMLSKHKTSLKVGTFGCLVVKGMQGWL